MIRRPTDGATQTDPASTDAAPAEHRPRVGFRREERREFRYVLSIATATAASWFTWLLPRVARDWIADRGGDALLRFSKTYRTNVLANLRQVIGPSVADDELLATARHVFRTSARNFADLLLIPRLDPGHFVRTVKLVEGEWSYIEHAIAQGRGVVLLTAHVGAFDYVGHTLSMRGYRVTSVTGRTTARFVFDAVTFLRRAHDAPIVEASPSGVRRVIRALRRGECAAFLTDRDFFQNGRPVIFFGRPTTLPPGAVRIARDTGALVVGAFARRTPDGYALSLAEPFEVERTGDVDADVDRGLAKVVRILERAIAETPEQWVMFQRVWPSAPVDPLRVFPVGSPLEGELLRRVDAVLPDRREPRSRRRGDPPPPEAVPTDRTDPPPLPPT